MEKKLSLYNASVHLHKLIEKIDNGADLTEELLEEFKGTRKEISEAVDRRKWVMSECDSKIEAGRNMIKQINAQIKKLKTTKEKIKSATLKSLEVNPDYKYTDTIGVELKKTLSPGKLEVDIPTKSFSLSNCVEPQHTCDPEIDNYIVMKVYYQIDTKRLIDDLKGGLDLDWARLNKSQILKGL